MSTNEWATPQERERLVVGVTVSAARGDASAALVCVTGQGCELRATLGAVLAEPLPKDTATTLNDAMIEPPGAVLRMSLARQLADVQADLIDRLLESAEVPRQRVEAVAVDDPGIWHIPTAGIPLYESLSDPARLAERTGLSVVDALPSRDLAAGGLGGPTQAMAQWLLLRDVRRARVLIHVGRTIRITYLPPGATGAAAGEVTSFDVGPGTQMLDVLARQLTSGQQAFDPGGHLAVQGRQISELLETWLADSYFERPLPRWHPRGVRPERFLNVAISKAIEKDWSVRDILCTATHLVAESTARAMRRHLSRFRDIHEVLLSGGGLHNGLLLRELTRRLESLPLIRVSDVGWPLASLAPASTAISGILFFDQTPASYPGLTGVSAPRVLGRLTPAPHAGWLRTPSGRGVAAPHFQTTPTPASRGRSI